MSRECPVCGHYFLNTKIRTMNFVLPKEWTLPSSYNVVRCSHCGMVYADVSGDYRQHYVNHSKYADARVGTSAGIQPWDKERFESIVAYIGRFVPQKIDRSKVKVLDYGCGAGGLLRSFFYAGFTDIWGYDPSPQAIAQCDIINKTSNLSALPHGTFDVVVLSHVLEHCTSPYSELAMAKAMLKPDGLLYIEVPNAERYITVQPFQDFNTEHINHFTMQDLRKLVTERAGMDSTSAGFSTVNATADQKYPVIFMLAKPHWTAGYTAECEQGLYELKKRFKEICLRVRYSDQNHGVTVWGVGQLLFKLLENGAGDPDVFAFVDRNSSLHGLHLLGVEIKPPEATDFGDRPIIVTSILNQQAILDDIKTLGLKNAVCTLGKA